MYVQEKVPTTEAAAKVGIGRVTLQRWIRAGKVNAPEAVIRNGRAVRLWSPVHVEQLRKAKDRLYHQGGGRKKKGSK